MAVEKLKTIFIYGLIVIAPVIILLVILQVLFNWSMIVVDPLVRLLGLDRFTTRELVTDALGLIIMVLFIFALGAVRFYRSRHDVLGRLSDFLDFIPLISGIYESVDRLTKTLTGRGGQYEKAVLVEYPREKMYKIGFVTGDAPGTEDLEDKYYSIFLPNSPNPTGGELLFVTEDRMHDIDMDVSDAMEMTMSIGTIKEDTENGQ